MRHDSNNYYCINENIKNYYKDLNKQLLKKFVIFV